MKKLLCLYHLLATFFSASSQSLPTAGSAFFAANGAYSENCKDAFSFHVNTASLAGAAGWSAGLYAENKFGLKELENYVVTAIYGIEGVGGIGMVLSYSGSEEFNESQLGLAYAKNLGRINLGVRFNYTSLRIAGYGGSGAFTYELGSTWKISERFFTGIQITNPQGGKFGKSDTEKWPAVYALGAGYACSDQLLITASIIKEENMPVSLRAGIRYRVAKTVYAALGMNSAASSPFIMLGWQWKEIRVLVSGSYHPQLGASTGITILFFGKNKKEES